MKILIVKTSALGDIIQTYPVIDYLSQRYPTAEIDWVVEAPFADLAEAHPLVNQVFRISVKAWKKALFSAETWQQIKAFKQALQSKKYDVVFDLQGNCKSALVTWMAKAKAKVGFGWRSVPERPNLLVTNRRINPPAGQSIRQDYLSIVQQYFNDSSSFTPREVLLNLDSKQNGAFKNAFESLAPLKKPLVMVCHGSAWPNKQLDPKELEDFLLRLQGHWNCSYVFLWGSEEERRTAISFQQKFGNSAHVLDRLPLPALQHVMSQANLIIAMDSLPLHLAATTAVPLFSVFGASSAAKYSPKRDSVHAMQGACPYGRKFEKRCPILRTCQTGACIRSIKGETLFEEFCRWNTG